MKTRVNKTYNKRNKNRKNRKTKKQQRVYRKKRKNTTFRTGIKRKKKRWKYFF